MNKQATSCGVCLFPTLKASLQKGKKGKKQLGKFITPLQWQYGRGKACLDISRTTECFKYTSFLRANRLIWLLMIFTVNVFVSLHKLESCLLQVADFTSHQFEQKWKLSFCSVCKQFFIRPTLKTRQVFFQVKLLHFRFGLSVTQNPPRRSRLPKRREPRPPSSL